MASPKSPVTNGIQTVPRPRVGSWLDRSAKKIMDLLKENFSLVGFDSDSTYLLIATDLAQRRAALAQQFHIGDAAAQRYFDVDALTEMAAQFALRVSGEKPGTDPFADQDTVPVELSAWSRAALSLMLGGRAVQERNAEYAWSMISLASSMVNTVAVLSRSPIATRINAPVAATTYAARVLREFAPLIREWGCGIEVLTAHQLADGLLEDSFRLSDALAANQA